MIVFIPDISEALLICWFLSLLMYGNIVSVLFSRYEKSLVNESVQKKDFIVIECIYSLQMCYFVIHSKPIWDLHAAQFGSSAVHLCLLN